MVSDHHPQPSEASAAADVVQMSLLLFFGCSCGLVFVKLEDEAAALVSVSDLA